MSKKNYYDILGVKPTVNQQAIKEAYRKLSKRIHPDVNGSDKYFEDYFKNIQEAYEVLSNENSRTNYDSNNGQQTDFDEAELSKLRQHIFNLESRNKELNTKLREVTADRNSIKYELDNYRQNYFEVKNREANLNSRIKELENRPTSFNSSSKTEDDEPNWPAWLLGAFIGFLFFMGYIDFDKEEKQNLKNELNNLRTQSSQSKTINEELNKTITSLKQDLTSTKAKLSKISNGTPFLVESILFYTSRNPSNYKTRFSVGEIDYIYPYIKIIPLTESFETMKVYVKIIDPDGSLNYNPQYSPRGYTTSDEVTISYADTHIKSLSGWGNTSRDAYGIGVHKVQVWANGKLLGEGSFIVI